jgi:hypothetical protein
MAKIFPKSMLFGLYTYKEIEKQKGIGSKWM